ncbi:MAG: GH1 family beta-glucosidase [Bacteroidia bacterium]|nr:GH1 family beta-glucosidase [Bacteroidia bacterium]MDW8158677.1 GH1 family beta-glucosidase [Bacteroidia bacterium]
MQRRNFLSCLLATTAGLVTNPNQLIGLAATSTLKGSDFGKNFVWGVATAAYQIEGAASADGKGPSIWDEFTHRKGKVKNNENGDKACEFYYRYKEDLELMRLLGIPAFRFSIAWSRLFPEGIGRINPAGVDFYHRVIDTCLEKEITPWITLYHWDLPLALEKKGGWLNREIIHWFSEYCDFCTKTYGDKVKNWMVLNEPMAFVGVGYFLGYHAPGRKGIFSFLKATHHATLAQGIGGKVVKANVSGANVGTTFSCSHIAAYRNDKEKDQIAAMRADALFNRLFLEPALGLGYPIESLPFLKYIERYFQPGDEEKMKFDFDFVGLQNYTRELVKYSPFVPMLWAKIVPASKRGIRTTEMGWEIYPEGIYCLLKKFASYPQVKKIYITENGVAFPDTVLLGEVYDYDRIEFLESYLKQVLRAKREGVPVEGYFIWSFMDNFEWAEGYKPRFGIVYVDFETQKRIIKQSGYWYRNLIHS